MSTRSFAVGTWPLAGKESKALNDCRIFDERYLKSTVARYAREAVAAGNPAPAETCNTTMYAPVGWYRCFHAVSGTFIVFSRDAGMHSCGWMKNPDYELCEHLSLSFREPGNIAQRADFDKKLAREWCELFFGEWTRYIATQSAQHPEGKLVGVVHYRVFCDAAWVPIIPRGEVYATEFTEAGFKTWSELNEELATASGQKEP